MKTVWKYVLDKRIISIPLPAGSKVLCANVQGKDICIWVLVEPKNEMETRRFLTVTTGEEFEENIVYFVGTVLEYTRTYVSHVFEIL